MNTLNTFAETTDTTADIERRFSSTNRLYGLSAAEAIRAAHVVVVGIGGVGSWTAEALARSGVGTLTLIDMDHIAESNINRQVHALDTTVGQAKIEAMRERIAHINPYCQVRCVDDFVTEDNWTELLVQITKVHGKVNGIIDACDQIRAKTAMAAWAMRWCNAARCNFSSSFHPTLGAAWCAVNTPLCW